MKRGLVVGIIVLFVLVIGLLFYYNLEEDSIESIDLYSCEQENDCAIAQIPCCSGSLITESINKNYMAEWEESKSIEYVCEGPCPGSSPSFFYEYSPQCIENKCEFTKEFNCKEGYEYVLEEGIEKCI